MEPLKPNELLLADATFPRVEWGSNDERNPVNLDAPG
jgi:hypothetical protein